MTPDHAEEPSLMTAGPVSEGAIPRALVRDMSRSTARDSVVWIRVRNDLPES
jgi:hypothetical protein